MSNWFHHGHHGCRGRSQLYTDQTICTFLMLKGIFNLTLRATQGLLDSLFELMNVPLCAPDYSCVSKRARTVTVAYRQPPKGRIIDLVIDSTGLKVFGEGEWKVRKHGAEKRRVWRKLHLAVDPATHDIVAAEISLENVHDVEVLPTLLNLYGDGIHLTVAHKREWSYGFKPDNKTVPLPCYLESPYDHQRESSTSQTQPASARQ